MSNKLTKKHDPFTRKFLSDPAIAKEFLAVHLAPEIQDKCNFDTLTIEPGSYVDDDLKMHCSDIVYRVDLKDSIGCAYIYTLVEHQSKPEKLMPLRIIRYQLAIIQQHLDKHSKHQVQLPVVVPIVFYNGIRGSMRKSQIFLNIAAKACYYYIAANSIFHEKLIC